MKIENRKELWNTEKLEKRDEMASRILWFDAPVFVVYLICTWGAIHYWFEDTEATVSLVILWIASAIFYVVFRSWSYREEKRENEND